MATVRWNKENGRSTLKHEEGFSQTLCGLDIPLRGKEWNAFGEPDCKRCIKAKKLLEQS
jgi:hypothetical protein